MGLTHENKVVIVTGASRGIGLGIARRLVADGARVVITARKPEALAEAVDALGGPAHALAIAGRADDPAHQDEVVAAARATFGRLDLLVNNAGINPAYGPMLDTKRSLPARSWRSMFSALSAGSRRPLAPVSARQRPRAERSSTSPRSPACAPPESWAGMP